MTDCWQSRAACAGMDAALWFPARGARVDSIRSICQGCPVRQPCLDYVMTLPAETDGVWGATTAQERKRLRRRLRVRAA